MSSPIDLSPTQLAIYYAHGEALSKYPISAEALADQLGVTRYNVRTVRYYINENGPPKPEDIPGAMHLIIPDAHARPNTNQDRFIWLGREIERVGREAIALGTPFKVISIGDFGDFPSLSSYDKGKASGENRRYADDIHAMTEALRLMAEEIGEEVIEYAEWHWLEGNHEYRAVRYMNDNPTMQGCLDIPGLFRSYGWKAHKFKDWVNLDSIGYCHYMQTPASGNAVSGVNLARSLLLAGHRSVVVGHNHRLDTAQDADVYGNPIMTLSCGCYTDQFEEYAGTQGNSKWWRGLVVLRDVKNGGYSKEEITLESLKRKYT